MLVAHFYGNKYKLQEEHKYVKNAIKLCQVLKAHDMMETFLTYIPSKCK